MPVLVIPVLNPNQGLIRSRRAADRNLIRGRRAAEAVRAAGG